MMKRLLLLTGLLYAASAAAQAQDSIDVAPFVSLKAATFVLDHVRVVDGTGAAAKEDQVVVVSNGKIQCIGPAAAQKPDGAQVLDRTGYTVIPG